MQTMTKELTDEQMDRVGGSIAGYIPLGVSHALFHASEKAINWLLGGNKSGKTYSNMMDLAMLAIDVHPYRYMPGGIHWACTESWDLVRDVLWDEYLRIFLPDSEIRDIQFGQDKVPKKVYLKSDHTIEFKAFNQGRRLFQGRTISSVHCDEQCHYDFEGIFNELQARVLNLEGPIDWSMTPILPQPYLENRILHLPDTDDIFHADLNDNRISRGGYMSDKRVDDLIDDWPDEVQTTRVKGGFSSYLGSVYRKFDRAVHVVPPFEIPATWKKYRGIDFGFTNPFVCLWMAQDPDDNWYVYREYYRAKTGIRDHATRIKLLSFKGEEYLATFADPENAEDRSELEKLGIPTKIARKDVARGIEMVQAKLKVKRNGKPSLFVFRDCSNTIREMSIYRYPKGSSVRNPKDLPLGVDDHTVDVVRYVIYTVERPRKKGSIFVS